MLDGWPGKIRHKSAGAQGPLAQASIDLWRMQRIIQAAKAGSQQAPFLPVENRSLEGRSAPHDIPGRADAMVWRHQFRHVTLDIRDQLI